MTASAGCQLIGRWRIVEADLWDRGYLDLGGPATITIGADNNGEIAFGALQAGLDLSYSPSMVFFTWAGCDEMDEVTGDGSAELLDDGSIEITFAYHRRLSRSGGREAKSPSLPRKVRLSGAPRRPRRAATPARRATGDVTAAAGSGQPGVRTLLI
jgi:hypothetical protein